MWRQWTLLLVLCAIPIARVDALISDYIKSNDPSATDPQPCCPETQHYCFDGLGASKTTSDNNVCDDLREIRYLPITDPKPTGFSQVLLANCKDINGQTVFERSINLKDNNDNIIDLGDIYGCIYVKSTGEYFSAYPSSHSGLTFYVKDVYQMVQRSSTWITKFYCFDDGNNLEINKDIACDRCLDHQEVLYVSNNYIAEVNGFNLASGLFCDKLDALEFKLQPTVFGVASNSDCLYVKKSNGNSFYARHVDSQPPLTIGSNEIFYLVFLKEDSILNCTTTTTSTTSVRRAPVRPLSLKETKGVYPFTTHVSIVAGIALGAAFVVGSALYVRTR